MSGRSKRNASSSHEMSTSSWSRVRLLGTMAMSSNPYARRPDLPMPISTSAIYAPRNSGGKVKITAVKSRSVGSAAGRADVLLLPPLVERWNARTAPSAAASGRADHEHQELGEDAGRGAPDRLAVELEEVHRSVVLTREVPALLAVHVVSEQLGQADVEHAGDLGGV